ncbi:MULTISPECIES: thioredoxin domain-containing protein [unclassified Clostridium]|uniref:thioredoxin domain-containing protein n=1 Tax=unclassified Clostridium TaxID=2614128 RepID=UPI00189A2122|nr:MULTISPECIES: thioredoxin domain-containing protein [unclassified Clostridium]MCR1949928.1 thioredoxin domain-containing protein [Clostridium sp. DSM 100503]
MFEEDQYEENIKSFNKILSIEADDLLNNEDKAIVYIGRSTCPYCRKFAKKLSELASKVTTPIHYVDSSNHLDNELREFRDKYNIVTVPGFIVHKNGEIEVRCDSSTPEDEILDMLK